MIKKITGLFQKGKDNNKANEAPAPGKEAKGGSASKPVEPLPQSAPPASRTPKSPGRTSKNRSKKAHDSSSTHSAPIATQSKGETAVEPIPSVLRQISAKTQLEASQKSVRAREPIPLRSNRSIVESARGRRGGDCAFPASSKREVKHKSEGEKRQKKSSKRSVPPNTKDMGKDDKSSTDSQTDTKSARARSLRRFGQNLVPEEERNEEIGRRPKRKTRRKTVKVEESKKGDDKAAEELKDAESDEQKETRKIPDEYALNKDDIDFMIRHMLPEQRAPDTNVYDPDVEDEELEKRTQTLFSLERSKFNAALSYALMDEEAFHSGKDVYKGPAARFDEKIERRTFNVTMRQRQDDDAFPLLDIVVQSSKEKEAAAAAGGAAPSGSSESSDSSASSKPSASPSGTSVSSTGSTGTSTTTGSVSTGIGSSASGTITGTSTTASEK